jgi:hypothetical protein
MAAATAARALQTFSWASWISGLDCTAKAIASAAHLTGAIDMKQLPGFNEATTLRQKAWAAGLDPSYWYPVENDRAVRPGQVLEVRFQGNTVALFRGSDGRLGTIRG